MSGMGKQVVTKVHPEASSKELEFNGITLPNTRLEKALPGILSTVKDRLATITPENVGEQREFIHQTIEVIEERLGYTDDGKSVNLLRSVRVEALEAFVRSFEASPPSEKELIAFCRDYVPDVRLKKKGSDTTIVVKGLTEAIRNVSTAGERNIRAAIDTIPQARAADRMIVRKILAFLPNSK